MKQMCKELISIDDNPMIRKLDGAKMNLNKCPANSLVTGSSFRFKDKWVKQ